MFNRVPQREHASLALSFISDIGVFLVHAYHDACMFAAANDCGEHGAGSVVSSETSFDVSRTRLDHKPRTILFVGICWRWFGPSDIHQRHCCRGLLLLGYV